MYKSYSPLAYVGLGGVSVPCCDLSLMKNPLHIKFAQSFVPGLIGAGTGLFCGHPNQLKETSG